MESLKVLVIDDDVTTCHLIETILQMEGYATASMNQIDKGDILALLNQHQPDILVMDFHLGSVEGLEYLRIIRGHKQWGRLRVIMTSAIDRQQDCKNAGADRFILKPFSWQQVATAVKLVQGQLG
jgi:CheY-like chemotaxis protein